jgi:uncharacterized caspase-like protein
VLFASFAQQEKATLVFPSGHGFNSNRLVQSLDFNADQSFLFTRVPNEKKVVCWEAQSARKVKEIGSIHSMLSTNKRTLYTLQKGDSNVVWLNEFDAKTLKLLMRSIVGKRLTELNHSSFLLASGTCGWLDTAGVHIKKPDLPVPFYFPLKLSNNESLIRVIEVSNSDIILATSHHIFRVDLTNTKCHTSYVNDKGIFFTLVDIDSDFNMCLAESSEEPIRTKPVSYKLKTIGKTGKTETEFPLMVWGSVPKEWSMLKSDWYIPAIQEDTLGTYLMVQVNSKGIASQFPISGYAKGEHGILVKRSEPSGERDGTDSLGVFLINEAGATGISSTTIAIALDSNSLGWIGSTDEQFRDSRLLGDSLLMVLDPGIIELYGIQQDRYLSLNPLGCAWNLLGRGYLPSEKDPLTLMGFNYELPSLNLTGNMNATLREEDTNLAVNWRLRNGLSQFTGYSRKDYEEDGKVKYIEIYNEKNELLKKLENLENRLTLSISYSKRWLIFNKQLVDLHSGITYSEPLARNHSFLEDTSENKTYCWVEKSSSPNEYIYALKELGSEKEVLQLGFGSDFEDSQETRNTNPVLNPELDELAINKDSSVFIYNLSKGKLIKRFQGSGTIKKFEWMKGGFCYLLSSNQTLYNYHYETGDLLHKRQFSESDPIIKTTYQSSIHAILVLLKSGHIYYLNPADLSEIRVLNENLKENGSRTSIQVKLFSIGPYLITDGKDESTQVRSLADGRILFSFMDVFEFEYKSRVMKAIHRLYFDPEYRFDGDEKAINQLYFTCGTEIIELDQVKESLYVPNLAQRILKGENLSHLNTLKELNICGVVPTVKRIGPDTSQTFLLTSRSGGLGEVEVYINGKLRLVETGLEKQLFNNELTYRVSEHLIRTYTQSNEGARISIIAKTRDNKISSRGVQLVGEPNTITETGKKPHLYAVIVGVDDYVGQRLDLNYAAKDAVDFHRVLHLSSQKFFNSNDTNRIHLYHFSLTKSGQIGATDIDGFTPDRNNILAAFDEIQQKSQPEDIVLVFFAGHGEIMENQLVLLTSEASADFLSGIKMQELMEKLRTIKAGKRVLLLDACHSGAAINELNMGALVGQRDTDEAEWQSRRIKELDKLSDKSGLAILTAAGSGEKALELPKYQHGLLTFALIKTMLQSNESIDEYGILQLEKWLMAAEKEVQKLTDQQAAQRFSPINFPMGIVDEEVRSAVRLSELPTLVLVNVQNDKRKFDNLLLREKLNKALSTTARNQEVAGFLIGSVSQSNTLDLNVEYVQHRKQLITYTYLSKNGQLVGKSKLKIPMNHLANLPQEWLESLKTALK